MSSKNTQVTTPTITIDLKTRTIEAAAEVGIDPAAAVYIVRRALGENADPLLAALIVAGADDDTQ